MKRRTKAEWEKIVSEYRESGQTKNAFCAERGISVKTLSNYTYNRPPKEKPPKEMRLRSLEEWASLILEQKESGKNRSAWCREHGVRADAMTKAERRLQAEATQITAKQEWLEVSPGAAPEVLAAKNDEIHCTVRIRMGNIEILAPDGYPAEKLAVLIKGLVRS